MAPRVESPFSAALERRWTFGMDWVLLLTLVAATAATLVGYALFLPSVTNELNAWIGRSVPPGNEDQSRRAQIVFLMLCYAAPMLLGLVARLVQVAGRKLVNRLVVRDEEDPQFHMD